MDARPDSESDAGEQFTRLLIANRNRIYGFIYTLVHDHQATNDIFQEVSAVLWKKFDQFEQGTDFGAWALSVSRFSVFEWRRKQKKVPMPLDDEQLNALADTAIAASPAVSDREVALRRCVEELPTRHRDLLRSRYFQEKPVNDIAADSKRTSRAVYRMLDRIHTALLDCIQNRLSQKTV